MTQEPLALSGPANRVRESVGSDASLLSSRPAISISNPKLCLETTQCSSRRKRQRNPSSEQPGYSQAMLSDPVFNMFPEPDDQRRLFETESNNVNREDRIIQKQYPMLYMNLNATQHADIADIQCETPEKCPLCQLDKNTLDSIKVLLPHEVRDYLISCNHTFTQEQVNVHLSHTANVEDNVVGVLQNMTIDLISRSYSLLVLVVFWLLYCVTGSFPHTIKTDNEPYGYAPYVWISVSSCNTQTGWCQGKTRSSFALTVAKNTTNDWCTHYCPGNVYANWRPVRESSAADLAKCETEGLMLGAYVNKLDKFSCLEIPGGFRCSDRVVKNTPLNKISIMLHAKPQNRDYYIGEDPTVNCGTDPQCASFKLLKRTLHATEKNRQWPDADEVLTIRNSPYACTLTYVGLGDTESLGSCYTQLGDNCFTSEGNRFCIGGSDKNPVGITNSDGSASAPIAICELSSKSNLKNRDPSCIPTSKEIRDFIEPSSCDATVISLDRSVYNSTHLSFDLDVATFHTVSETGHVIMGVSLDECLIPFSSTSRAFHSTVTKVAETLAKIRIATHSIAIMLDASEWGVTACQRNSWLRTDFTKTAEALASALIRAQANKLFLRLPGSKELVTQIDFTQLQAFEAFVTPRGKADMKQNGHCQNMWTRGGQGSSDGIMAYVLTLLRKGVPANRVIFTLSLTGGLKISSLEHSTSSTEVISELTLADMESNTVLKCEEDLNTKCCSGSSEAVWVRNAMVNITVTSTSFETLTLNTKTP